MLEPFDAPVMTPNCEQRASSTVAPQSLLMMNSAFVVQQAEGMAGRIEHEVGAEPAAQFRRAWLLAFSRTPSESQVQAGIAFLAEQAAAVAANANADPKTPALPPARAALARLCQALVSSNGFLYVD
jgi:hypothetical protein